MPRRLRRYQTAMLAVVGLLATSVPMSAPTRAAGGDFHWSASFGGYVDDNCADPNFDLRIFERQDYIGRRVRICSVQDSFCIVPMWGNNPCGDIFDESANDQMTSYKVIDVPAGRCIRFNEHANGGGANLTTTTSDPNVGSWWNDKVSSARLGC